MSDRRDKFNVNLIGLTHLSEIIEFRLSVSRNCKKKL